MDKCCIADTKHITPLNFELYLEYYTFLTILAPERRCISKMRRQLTTILFLVVFVLPGIAKNKNKSIIKDYPKSGIKTIHLDGKATKIKVFDLHGKLCLKAKGNALDLSNLPNGWYLIKTKSGSQVVQKLG